MQKEIQKKLSKEKQLVESEKNKQTWKPNKLLLILVTTQLCKF